MKRILTGLMAVVMLLTVAACGNTDKKADEVAENITTKSEAQRDTQRQSMETGSESTNESAKGTDMGDNLNVTNSSTVSDIKKIKIVTPDGNIIIKLEDNKATADLLNMLPMTIHFEDFNKTEKISYMNDKLDTSDAVTEYAPEAGSFAYYIPWGNLSLFYEPFRQSSELAELGVVESGMEYIKNMDKYDSVTIQQDR